ncbi:MAG: hypothetical protein AAB913_02105 [Patescibacteria group bacterium]
MKKRILVFLILLLSILYMPFWLSIILILIAMAYFLFFLEGIVLFFLSDLLYGTSEIRFLNIFFISTIISFLFLIIIELLKKKIRISK